MGAKSQFAEGRGHTGCGWRLDRSTHDAQIDAVVALAQAVERAQHRAEPARLLGCRAFLLVPCGRLVTR